MTRPYNPPEIQTTVERAYTEFREHLGFDISDLLVPGKLSDYEKFEHRWADQMAARYRHRAEIAVLIEEKEYPKEVLVSLVKSTNRQVRLED